MRTAIIKKLSMITSIFTRTSARTSEDFPGARRASQENRERGLFSQKLTINEEIDLNTVYKVQQFLRDNTPPLIIQTTGGSSIATTMICKLLKRYQGIINIYVPNYALSSGTLIALSGHNLFMKRDAFLSPVDTQITFGGDNPMPTNIPDYNIKTKPERSGININTEITLPGIEVNDTGYTEFMIRNIIETHKHDDHHLLNYILPESIDVSNRIKITQLLLEKHRHDYSITIEELRDVGIKIADLDKLNNSHEFDLPLPGQTSSNSSVYKSGVSDTLDTFIKISSLILMLIGFTSCIFSLILVIGMSFI